MRLSQRLLVACALVLIPAAPSLAADYDPPIYIEQAPEFVPVEVGSGWYIRGDLSYNFDGPDYDYTIPGGETNNRRFGGGLGAGYHFTDMLRGDVTINYLGRDTFDGAGGGGVIAASHSAWSGMANAYLDLATVVGITPYVGAGVGVLYTKHDDFAFLPDDQYRFAYALMAGASYKVTDNLSVDLGYQYLNSPKTQYQNFDMGTVGEGVEYHQVKLGLRYDLW
jgi:opacity protein-like surface antigen